MICEFCGTQLDDDTKYCSNCKDYCSGITEDDYEKELMRTETIIREWNEQ